jgi:hypothetical protein
VLRAARIANRNQADFTQLLIQHHIVPSLFSPHSS